MITSTDHTPVVSAETARIARQVISNGYGRVSGVLRAAADKVERLAAEHNRHGLPWYADLNGDESVLRAQPTPVSPGSDVLMGGGYIVDEFGEKACRWFAATGPQIAGALVALLRATAAERVAQKDTTVPGFPEVHLIELAVELLHEESPDDGDFV